MDIIRRGTHPIYLSLILLLSVAASACLGGGGMTDTHSPRDSFIPRPRTYRDFGKWVVDGLHVTGSPNKVDIATYRLQVSGNVRQPLSLSYDEVRAMPPVRERVTLVCPGVFVDEGTWTGVPLRDILQRAGVESGSGSVAFISINERYRAELPLAKVMGDGFLISYEFEGIVFDRRNGFPLRLVARNEPGHSWVKWLGRIEVIQESNPNGQED